MSHHAGHPFDGGQSLDSFHEQFKNSIINDLGATGKFPDGKLTDNDEGEIKIGVTVSDERVVLAFGKKIEWIGLTREQAIQIGQTLIDRARQI